MKCAKGFCSCFLFGLPIPSHRWCVPVNAVTAKVVAVVVVVVVVEVVVKVIVVLVVLVVEEGWRGSRVASIQKLSCPHCIWFLSQRTSSCFNPDR